MFYYESRIVNSQKRTTEAERQTSNLSLSFFRSVRSIAQRFLIALSLCLFLTQSALAAEESIWVGSLLASPTTFPYQITITEHSENNVQAVAKFRSVRFGNSVYKLKGVRKGDMLQLVGYEYIEKGKFTCLPSIKLRPSDRRTLIGPWGPNSKIDGGCPSGASGLIQVKRQLSNAAFAALPASCKRRLSAHIANSCFDARNVDDTVCVGIRSYIRTDCPAEAWP